MCVCVSVKWTGPREVLWFVRLCGLPLPLGAGMDESHMDARHRGVDRAVDRAESTVTIAPPYRTVTDF